MPHAWLLAEARGPVERLPELARRTEDLAVVVGTLRGQRFLHEAALREKDSKISRLEALIHDLNNDIREDYERYSSAKLKAKERQNEQESALQELRDKLHRVGEEIQSLKHAHVPPSAAAPPPPEPSPPGPSLALWWERLRERLSHG